MELFQKDLYLTFYNNSLNNKIMLFYLLNKNYLISGYALVFSKYIYIQYSYYYYHLLFIYKVSL